MLCTIIVMRPIDRALGLSFRCGLRGMALLVRENQEYQRAVTTLNGLQTNASVLAEIRRHGDRQPFAEQAKMREYLIRVGLAVDDLNQLNVIHVAGTKGKGSVCALCESILRAHGLKTGFYSSPHLLEVRERIRINGLPLKNENFVSKFWDVYGKLKNSEQRCSNSMPSYFRFLTVMAFAVFLQEKVDVAVIEVGIGGTYDSTNIIPQPVVCGISSLGYDHTDILGTSLAQIAWHKGGICKPGRPAFSLPQPPDAMEALIKRAQELQVSSFKVVPPLSAYLGPLPKLSLQGSHQSYNASLAVQLCQTWLQATSGTRFDTTTEIPSSTSNPFTLSNLFRYGLEHCVWAGRTQVFKKGNITYYLDGAHTPQSVEASAEWFLSQIAKETTAGRPPIRVLLFNITGSREAKTFLSSLVTCKFTYALFSPNIVATDSNSPDHVSLNTTAAHQMAGCYANEKALQELLGASSVVKTKVFPCLSQVVQYLQSVSTHPLPEHCSSLRTTHSNPHPVAVLVTGSLHLVGATMRTLGMAISDV